MLVPSDVDRAAARTEHARPERQAEFLRDLVGEIPLLRERPQEQIRERTEDGERDQRQHERGREHLGPPHPNHLMVFAECCR
jgi:hypothetical protein